MAVMKIHDCNEKLIVVMKIHHLMKFHNFDENDHFHEIYFHDRK